MAAPIAEIPSPEDYAIYALYQKKLNRVNSLSPAEVKEELGLTRSSTLESAGKGLLHLIGARNQGPNNAGNKQRLHDLVQYKELNKLPPEERRAVGRVAAYKRSLEPPTPPAASVSVGSEAYATDLENHMYGGRRTRRRKARKNRKSRSRR